VRRYLETSKLAHQEQNKRALDAGSFREALNNSSMNYQSTKKVKFDFTFFFIFNGLSAIENGSTSMCCGNSELIRVSLG
jgi:hypothetical protein